MTKVWESLWSNYENIPSGQIMNDPAGKGQREEFVDLLEKHFELQYKRILEVGTGTGQYSIELENKGAYCTGIDVEQESIDLAQRIAKDYKSSVQLEKMDLFDMTYQHYDIVFSMGTVEHFTNAEIIKMFRKMAELGDYVIVGVPYSGSHAYMLSKEMSMAQGTWEYGVENDFMSLKALFSLSGLEMIEETTIGSVAEAMYLKRTGGY